MKKKMISISVGPCWFCDWKPAESQAKIIKIDEAVYVFCPKCGLEIPDALFLIGDDIEE